MEAYVPTPEEIRAKCWEIQAEWSAGERRNRIADHETRAAASRSWSAPAVHLYVPPAQAGC